MIDECKRLRVGVVWMTTIGSEVERVATALQGLRVLTVGTLPEHTKSGMVLSFAVRSGKPRVLVNLPQAHRQEVDFRADFLRMAEVLD